MRTLKSIGLVIVGGLYVLFFINVPFWMGVGLCCLIAAIGLFIWGYFILFKPKG